MSGFGRLLGLQAMSSDGTRRHDDDEWRALHRRPDALPLPDDEPAVVTDNRHREGETFRLRRLVARFARH
jgi:hypothetical protein